MIEIVLESGTKYRLRFCELYDLIAEEFDSTGKRVERANRHAIERAFEIGDIEKLNEIFCGTINSVSGKVTNAQFVFTIAEYLKLEQE